jgi:hypothetical protein
MVGLSYVAVVCLSLVTGRAGPCRAVPWLRQIVAGLSPRRLGFGRTLVNVHFVLKLAIQLCSRIIILEVKTVNTTSFFGNFYSNMF